MNRKSNWKSQTRDWQARRAFTLIELLVVIATVCLLASLMLPALAHAKAKSPAAACLSSLRQMQLGATMYRDDFNDILLPNAPLNGGPNDWVKGVEGWQNTFNANTNVADYSGSALWSYINQDISIYRCPADFIPSANGYRIRSRSMNGQMGLYGESIPYNSGWRQYQKGSDLTCPAPANAFIFCDETAYSINDGFLELDLNVTDFPDVPAAYHAGGCGFSFADGHAEIHRWQGPSLIAVPYAYGVANNGIAAPASGIHDPDWNWLAQRAACRIGN